MAAPIAPHRGGHVSISALSDRGLLQIAGVCLDEGAILFQYPLFRIVDCFHDRAHQLPSDLAVSISALSDRGLLHHDRAHQLPSDLAVSISALSDRGLLRPIDGVRLTVYNSFNIRSFGSWIASNLFLPAAARKPRVSISALSDRGLLQISGNLRRRGFTSFNIRSFGSWIASEHTLSGGWHIERFNIRSFGSWIASAWLHIYQIDHRCVSISALSDRGLLPP